MSDNLTLSGIRVLDLTRSIAGPWAVRMLADAGAEVIKVEPLAGDFIRQLPAHAGEFSSGFFRQANSGKRSVCIDLHTAAGIDLVMQLIPHADVVMHNMRPNAARRLNMVPERIHEINPSAIFCSVSGYGDNSVFVEKPGQDVAIQAMTGISELTGVAGGEPAVPIWSMVDTLTSAYTYIGIMSALHARASRGLDRLSVQVSMAQCSATLHDVGPYLLAQGEKVSIERSGQFHPFLVLRGVVAVQDGFIAISAFRNRDWARLAPLIGFGGELLSFDERRGRKREIEERAQSLFAHMTIEDALAQLKDAGVPAHQAIESLESVSQTGLFQEHNMLVQTEGPTLVAGIIHRKHSAEALLGGSDALGGSNLYALHEILGLEKGAILDLLSEGIIGCEPDILEDLVAQCSDAMASGDVA